LVSVAAGGTASRPVDAVPDPLALLRALRHHWLLALVLGTAAGATAGAVAWRIVPRPAYTASALLEVRTQRPYLLNANGQERTELRVFQATQLALARSRLVLAGALSRPGVTDLPTVRAQPDPQRWLEEELAAEFQAGSELMRLSLAGDRPADLAFVVNALARAYLDEILTKDHAEHVEAARKLASLLGDYNAKLARQRADLKQLAESVGSDDKQTLALKQQLTEQHLGQERSELNRVQTELKRLQAELRVLETAGAGRRPWSPGRVEVDDLLAREPALEQYRSRADELTDQIERLRRRVKSESDPSLRELRTKLTIARRAYRLKADELTPKAERRLRDQAERRDADRLAELGTQAQILTEYEKVLRESVARLDKEAQSFNRQTIDLQWIKDEIAQNEQIARQLGTQLQTMNVELKAPQRGRVVEPADNPRLGSPRKRHVAIAMAALGAFSCTVLCVCWREYRLRRVGSPDEVVVGLGLRLVGTLPALPPAGRRRGRGGPQAGTGGPSAARWQSLLIESVDATRAVMLRECCAGDVRTVMVTSASKGEGKSSLASHLAVSLARTGRRTLLADFDLRSPSAHLLFELPDGPGVCELLLGEATVGEAACAVTADLDVIPAGRCTDRAVRALGRDALPALLGRLKTGYDFVLIDSAPVLPVADSLLIGQHADAVILSVYREVSRIPAVRAGYERLASLGARVLGVVVTGVSADPSAGSYGDLPARRN
jgi:succinoglycan biosynthesis transport protein ExoP